MARDEGMFDGPERAVRAAEEVGGRVHRRLQRRLNRQGWHERPGNGVWGAVLIVLGVLFLLSNLDVIDFRLTLRTLWPLALVAWGVHQVVTCRGTGRVFGIALIGFGNLLFLDRAFGWDVDVWDLFWPTMLILFGIHVFFNSRRLEAKDWRDPPAGTAGAAAATPPPIPRVDGDPAVSEPMASPAAAATDPVSGRVDSSSMFKELAVLSGIERRNISQTFRGGEATAILGGIEIDLRECRMASGDAFVDVLAIMGGIELRIPKGWTVESRVSALLAGFEDRSEPPVVPGAPRLIIRGTVFMGGIEIRN
jgi:hypothetical protein